MATYYDDRTPGYREPRQSSALAFIWPVALLVILVTGLVWWFWQRSGPLNDPNAAPRPVVARGDLAEEEKATIQIFKEASSSVVHITTLTQVQNFLSFNIQEIPQGTGSGFMWDEEGHIVTNNHVVEGGNAAQVTLSDKSTYKASLVGTYPDKDLAVLWISAPKSKLRPILIGSSHDLQVGQNTYAIGNPFGLDHTLTTGIVSAVGREITSANHRKIQNVIQTDAAINPGNSGGPLLDSAARLIGVNTAIFSPSGGFVGIGFAIPVDEVNRTVPQIIAHGKVIRPSLGIQPADDQLSQQALESLGLAEKGVLIIRVVPNSPADQAGLQGISRDSSGYRLGDIIVAIDDKPVPSKDDLYAALEQHKPGDKAKVTVLRNGKRQDVEVTLGGTTS